MRNKVITFFCLLNLITYTSCSKSNSNIYYVDINKEYTTKGKIPLNFNDEGIDEVSISTDFSKLSSTPLFAEARFYIEPTLFDIICSPQDSIEAYFIVANEKDFVIEANNPKWYSKIAPQFSKIVNFFMYADASAYGSGIKQWGPIGLGKKYCGFRFNGVFDGVTGWRYGWIQYEATKEKFTIVDFAFNKTVNASIKCGEK